jgi:hypothetical protein
LLGTKTEINADVTAKVDGLSNELRATLTQLVNMRTNNTEAAVPRNSTE